MVLSASGWTLRLRDLLGSDLAQITESDLERLIKGQVREDDDLDFKQACYGASDSDKRELAADIAAMANHRGGVIIVGIREESEVAVELTPVEPPEGEEGRMRQIGASAIAPHVEFDVRVVPSENNSGRSYYLLIVPPSPLRPHAVRKNIDLRYPSRDGSHTRWLAEAEVSSMYRDRFGMVEDQVSRLTTVADEGLAQMDLRDDWAYLTTVLVPTSPGAMPMGHARIRKIEEWAAEPTGNLGWRGFYGDRPNGRAGIRRVRLGYLANAPQPVASYSELHTDGTGFCCEQVGRTPPTQDETEGCSSTLIPDTGLLWVLAQSLRLLGRHAVENTAAWGDAVVLVRLQGRAMQLTRPTHGGILSEPWNHNPTSDQVVTRHTVSLASLTGADQDLLASARIVGTDLFNAFGAPEIAQIDENGRIRRQHLHNNYQAQIVKLAERFGVEISDERIPGA